MRAFLFILIIIFLLNAVFRRYIYFKTFHSFKKAAEDFSKQRDLADQKRKEYGKVTVEQAEKKSIADEGEYVPFEEVKE